MSVLRNAQTLARLTRWGAKLLRRDLRRAQLVSGNPKFTTAREAVGRIRDGAAVGVSGLAAQQRASTLYWALREAFEETGHPRGLTLLNVGGHGSRGLLPGSLDELAIPGLCARLVTSHFETFRPFLDLAARGRCVLQCLPLGVMAQLYAALGRGEDSLLSATGIGTFLDPRTGRGSPVRGGRREQLVTVEGDLLRYRIPPIDVALFNLPAADRRGNLYAKGSAMIGDALELAQAARRRGGLVIANVGRLVDEGYGEVFLPAESVDAIVLHPDTEQTPGYTHADPWPAVTVGGDAIADALEQARFVGRLAGLIGGVAQRGALDDAVARLAATTLVASVAKGAFVAIGAGMPEGVARAVFEAGRLGDVTFAVESGVVGGLPAPGAYFGASLAPRELVSTAELFRRCERGLDAACLGALEVDAAGNVNVSKRGRGVRRYAGPGGFIDFTEAAQTIVFVSGWMRGGSIDVGRGGVRLRSPGEPKFVEHVSEVTFDAERALGAGKQIHYVTPVGVFQRTSRGMELTTIMPGIDLHEDVLGLTPIEIVRPEGGEVPVAPRAIVDGEEFRLPAWGSARAARD